jgi:aryl-alcohol dehydrogenase-like predicted oxidoreductase
MPDQFVAAVGTFIDTADAYGASEETVGRWLARRSRDDLAIATKLNPKTWPQGEPAARDVIRRVVRPMVHFVCAGPGGGAGPWAGLGRAPG